MNEDVDDNDKVNKGRNQSKIKAYLSTIAKEQGIKPTLATMSVKLGLNTALSHHPKKLCRKLNHYFDDRSRSLGCWRWYISLYAGYRYASACCLHKNDDNLNAIPRLTKTFFDKCWSAADHIRMGWKVRATDEIEPMKQFIRETNFPINDLPDRMPGEYELRSPISRDMYDVSKTYIHKMFPKWVYAACRFELLCLFPSLQKEELTQISRCLFICVLCCASNLDDSISRLRVASRKIAAIVDKIDAIVAVQEKHRVLLKLLLKYKYKNMQGWAVALKVEPQLAFPYLACMSRTYEQYWGGLDDNGRYWAKCNRIPQSFSLIPIWKCEPVYVDFASTQMQLLYNKFGGKGRPQLDPLNLDKGDLNLFDLSTIPQLRCNYKKKINWHVTGLSTNGVELVVKLSAFKDHILRRPMHTVNREHLFKAGYNIPKPSSKVTVKTQRGVYKVSETRYDICPLSKKEYDVGLDKDVEIVCIDPGCSDVISVRQSVLACGSNPGNIVDHSATWSISNKTYQTMVGSGQHVSLECGRRNLNSNYGKAIRGLAKTCRRSVVLETLQHYIEQMRPYLKKYMKEVTSRYRRYVKWQIERRRTGVVDCLASMIFGKITDHTERRLMCHVDRYQPRKSWKPTLQMSESVAKRKRYESQRLIECRKCLRNAISRARENSKKHRVCFFGDGSFGSRRGNAPVPRKDLVRALARNGLTIMLDEFRTSARCPGCGSEMKDDDKGHRIRQCSSIDDKSNERNIGGCCLHSGHGTCTLGKKVTGGVYKADRDEVATINMMMCAISALEYGRPKNERRPAHLCRNATLIDESVSIDRLIYDTGNVSY